MYLKKLFVFVVTLLVVALLAMIVTPVVHAQGVTSPPVPLPAEVLNVVVKIMLGFASLVGVSGLTAALVNLLKIVKVVQDGTSDKWAAAINLLFFIGLVVFGVFKPDLATAILDGYAGQIAMVILFVLGFITQITGSKPMYEYLKASGVPLLSKSYSTG